MRVAVVALALMLTGESAAEAASLPPPRPHPAAMGKTAPLPPPRPDPLSSAQSTKQPAATASGTPRAEAPPQPSACQVALRAVALFAPEPPIDGPGNCGIADPVRIEAVILPDRTRVAVDPPAVLRCEMAAAVTHWIRDEMAPAAARLGSPLRGIENFDSYDCRGRNRVRGAKMSEHGRGNAFDIKGMKLESGTVALLTDPHVAKGVRDDLRKSACGRFTTVLGPSSDGYHENHIHVDLAERRGNYRLCQWEVRQPLDRVSPSPHIASSRAPTPFESMPSDAASPGSSPRAETRR